MKKETRNKIINIPLLVIASWLIGAIGTTTLFLLGISWYKVAMWITNLIW